MRALGTYILAGRLQAIVLISFLSVLSLLVPPLIYLFSGVPLALVTLRKGAGITLQVIVGSLLLVYLFSLALKIQPLLIVSVMASIWLPVYLCALVLRLSERPAVMALAAAALAMIFIVFMYISIADVEDWWRDLLESVLASGLPADMTAQYQQAMEVAPKLMNAVIASSLVLSLVVTVLLGRWWQSRLFNPGGFRREFHNFRLPRSLVLPSLACMGLSLVQGQVFTPVVRDTLVVLVVLYLFHGIASVHRTVAVRGLSVNWLIALYCLLGVLPQLMVLMVAWMGLTDSLLDRDTARPKKPED